MRKQFTLIVMSGHDKFRAHEFATAQEVKAFMSQDYTPTPHELIVKNNDADKTLTIVNGYIGIWDFLATA